jgi:hypothetical protein
MPSSGRWRLIGRRRGKSGTPHMGCGRGWAKNIRNLRIAEATVRQIKTECVCYA